MGGGGGRKERRGGESDGDRRGERRDGDRRRRDGDRRGGDGDRRGGERGGVGTGGEVREGGWEQEGRGGRIILSSKDKSFGYTSKTCWSEHTRPTVEDLHCVAQVPFTWGYAYVNCTSTDQNC